MNAKIHNIASYIFIAILVAFAAWIVISWFDIIGGQFIGGADSDWNFINIIIRIGESLAE